MVGYHTYTVDQQVVIKLYTNTVVTTDLGSYAFRHLSLTCSLWVCLCRLKCVFFIDPHFLNAYFALCRISSQFLLASIFAIWINRTWQDSSVCGLCRVLCGVSNPAFHWAFTSVALLLCSLVSCVCVFFSGPLLPVVSFCTGGPSQWHI